MFISFSFTKLTTENYFRFTRTLSLFISLYPTIKTGEVEGQRRGSIGGGGDSTVTLVVTLVTGVACACVEGPPRIDQPIPTSFPLLNT